MNKIWDQEMIEKYNYSGPRYTSYPTALEFKESEFDVVLEKASQCYPDHPLSIYVHIPFCHKLCYYCACSKLVTQNQNKADIYLDSLEKEIILRGAAFKSRTVTQLHWGGGTPTFLTPQQRKRLVMLLRENFNFSPDIEMSIEVDPRSLEVEELPELRALGFNRMSLGVQDFNSCVQKAINREQSMQQIKDLLQAAKDLEFTSTNLDLIYGLPLQNVDNFAYTLEQAIALDAARLSVFNYAHLPQMFPSQKKLNESDFPMAADKLAMLEKTITMLTDAGYEFIGMDHFAKPDDELAIAQKNGVLHRNFQGYTTHAECDLIGLGVTSISMIGHAYIQNKKNLKEYEDAVNASGSALWKGVELNVDDLIRRKIIKDLMCNFTLDIKAIENSFNIDFFDYFAEDMQLLQTFIDDHLVDIKQNLIVVAPQGRMLIRNICMCFDFYLRQRNRQRQFSRII